LSQVFGIAQIRNPRSAQPSSPDDNDLAQAARNWRDWTTRANTPRLPRKTSTSVALPFAFLAVGFTSCIAAALAASIVPAIKIVRMNVMEALNHVRNANITQHNAPPLAVFRSAPRLAGLGLTVRPRAGARRKYSRQCSEWNDLFRAKWRLTFQGGLTTMTMRKKQRIIAVAAMAFAGCATSVKTTPVDFISVPGAEIAMARNIHIELPTHYARTLPKGGRWRKVGTVPQGNVYRSIDDTFTIEGRNMHEAYLVLTDTHALIGFYLPGESSLSMLPSPL
jgi:hypothetical protein